MGASKIFRRYYELPDSMVVPLSIAHGIDWGRREHPYDIMSPEPIHWGCCPSLESYSSKSIKPILFAPHPWLLNIENLNLKVSDGDGILLIGPPPSPKNDRALFELIKDDLCNSKFSILIKQRGKYLESIEFWESKGVKCYSAGSPDEGFYTRLFNIINLHKVVMAGSFSSAIIFASSIGKDIKILEDYSFEVFEKSSATIANSVFRESAKKIIQSYVHNSTQKNQDLSLKLMGSEMLTDKARVRKEFLTLIDTLSEPCLDLKNNLIPWKVRKFIARKLSKPNILNFKVYDYLERLFFREKISIVEVSEFNIWKNGLNSQNFRETQVSSSNILKFASLGSAPNGYNR